MPIHKVKGGYQWGHQKVYPTKAGAEKQAEAIYASGYKGEDAAGGTAVATGIMFCTPSGSVLWLKRSPDSEAPGYWDFPGGMMEEGESAEEAAVRETEEETSYVPEGERKEVYDDGFYKTFRQDVEGEFQVVLNEEHVGWCWATLSDPPQPVHPCIGIMLGVIGTDNATLEGNSAIPMVGRTKKTGALDSLALDRNVDVDGHLHVASSVISSAQVNDYRAEEIPKWQELGLESGKVYALLRDPIELEKGCSSLHGKPLLIIHKPVTAGDHDREVVVGSVHNPVWESPNIKAELTVWDDEAIELINSGEKKDLSAGYRYVAVMQPGEFNGVHYDGRMTEIEFNHTALVKTGRVIGAFVGDEALKGNNMAKEALVRKAIMVKGAILAHLRPVLAADAKIDLNSVLVGTNMAEFKRSIPQVTAGVLKLVEGKTTGKFDGASLNSLLIAMDAEAEKEEKEREKAVGDKKARDSKTGMDAVKEFMKEKMSEDDYKAACDMMEGEDEEEEEEEKEEEKEEKKAEDAEEEEDVKTAENKGKDKKMGKDKRAKDAEPMMPKSAMDAAIKSGMDSVRAAERGIRVALDQVEPWVGKLSPSLALDSAADVHREAAKILGVPNAAKLHPDALWPIIQAQPKPGVKTTTGHVSSFVALDSASTAFDEAAKIAPGLARIKAA